jgi:exonuclease III
LRGRTRLLAWNIRHGGGSRLARIAEALMRQDADILILSEYRGGDAATRLTAALDALGYRHVTQLVPPPSRNGVLIAARCSFREHGALDRGLPEPCRMVSVEFVPFRLIGVYMPNLLAKIAYWDADRRSIVGSRRPRAGCWPLSARPLGQA